MKQKTLTGKKRFGFSIKTFLRNQKTKLISAAGALLLGAPAYQAGAQITLLHDYHNNTSAAIGTYDGINFREGGFSGLFPIAGTNGTEYWTLSDRGPNVDDASANPAACHPTYDKMFIFPDYAPKIHRIRIDGDSIQILQTIVIKRPDGTSARGVLSPTGLGSTAAEVASTDTVLDCANFSLKTTAKDTFGIDCEAILVDGDGNFWVSEENGPTIWKLSPTGVLLKRYTPYANLPGAQSVDSPIDTIFKYRKNNRGFENLCMTPNGKLYAVIQSPLLNPTQAIGENTRVHRILEIDPVTDNMREFVYLNDGIIGSGSNQIRLRDWKLGDIAAINNTQFLILEAAARGTTDIKRMYKIDISAATPVTSGLYGGVSLEALATPAGLTAQGIVPVTKALFMDLLASGWPSSYDKAEGLAIINDSTLAICNDNDFGQASPLADGIPLPTGTLSHLVTFGLSGLNKAGVTGPSSSASPYVLPVAPGVTTTSILSVPDHVGIYEMEGIPDGLGAFNNEDGTTFTLLANHELGSTTGVTRAHGGIGAFVSKWVINKSTLQVQSGSDLITSVYGWNTSTQSSNTTPGTFSFNRFCSADLAPVSAFYNPASGLGTQERIYMNGEEGGATGFHVATVVTGPNAGKAYILGKFNLSTNGSGITAVGAQENTLANPYPQDKTVVVVDHDGGTGIMTNAVAVYQGMKTSTGTEVDKAGLTNGTLKFIVVSGNAVEITNATTRTTGITSGTAFSLSGTSSTTFSRPEDGNWDPSDPTKYYFVTTDRLDQVLDSISPFQIGRSRLWRLNFTDITNPDLGGTIDLLLNGTEGYNMFDNMAIDHYGHILLQEDVGGAPHNGKVWQYTIATGNLKMIAKHDASRFGDIVPKGVVFAATAPFNNDEETSGIIDVQNILGPGMFISSDQAHYTSGIPSAAVEGGQFFALYNPDTYNSAQLSLSTSVSNVNCNGALTGAINLTVSGGKSPYSYAWSNSTTTEDLSGVAAGTYTVIVTDALGITASTSATISEPTAVTATGSNSNVNLFFGYSGDQTTQIQVTPSGGVAPYSISITMNRPLVCNSVNDAGDESWSGSSGTTVNNTCPANPNPATLAPMTMATGIGSGGSLSVTATLMQDATFTATVTDASGCTAIYTTQVNAEDVRCFAGNNNITKVTICHQTGSPNKPCIKICINPSDVAEHLAHGDFVGNCTNNCVAPAQKMEANAAAEEMGLYIMPNPATSAIKVFFNTNESESYHFMIVDITGKVVYQNSGVSQKGINEATFDLNSLSKGLYQVQIISRSVNYNQKLVLQ